MTLLEYFYTGFLRLKRSYLFVTPCVQGLGEIKARDIDNGKWNVSPSLPPLLRSILRVGRLLVVHCVESLSGSWDADDAAALCQK